MLISTLGKDAIPEDDIYGKSVLYVMHFIVDDHDDDNGGGDDDDSNGDDDDYDDSVDSDDDYNDDDDGGGDDDDDDDSVDCDDDGDDDDDNDDNLCFTLISFFVVFKEALNEGEATDQSVQEAQEVEEAAIDAAIQLDEQLEARRKSRKFRNRSKKPLVKRSYTVPRRTASVEMPASDINENSSSNIFYINDGFITGEISFNTIQNRI
ncbi:hypothetical protein ElyMa_003967800 [Elysia marginata]|uniref:Uncharacterized protein n=1 Tax=Elysia marginata TaxID=1093978 RepID=A0AAV4FVH3_9GAST|nr:hypothetical protein ElyMa_003967800 [Elysia marginata]